MSVRVLVDRQELIACLYDSTTMRAFGPIFDYSEHDPADFLEWLEDDCHTDPRTMHPDELEAKRDQWIDETQCCSEARTGSGEHAEDCRNYAGDDNPAPSGPRAE